MSRELGFTVVKDCPGRFPVHVISADGHPHPALTVYANKAGETLVAGSVAGYLGELLRIFSWAQNDKILNEEGCSLTGDSDQVRKIVHEYLVADGKCVLRQRQGDTDATSIVVRVTNDTRVNVKLTLSALKHFYRVLSSCQMYEGPNPLVSEELARSLSDELRQKQNQFIEEHGRASPTNSGGVDDNWRNRLRYSTNYFQLLGSEWEPQVISDSHLPSLIYKAGAAYGWSLRSEVIARLLFESGGRISDVVARTLADWLKHDCLSQLESDSKGSYGKRVKTLSFSTPTANLLRRYFNTERVQAERGPHKTLGEMRRAAKAGVIDPTKVPLFLTARGSAYSAKSFRDECWRPALALAGLKCQPHQTRHWFVTAVLNQIDETATTEVERARRRTELVKYMRWRSGESMLSTYDHTGTRAAARIASLHAKMRDFERSNARSSLTTLKALTNRAGASSRSSDELEALFKLVGDDDRHG